jgi:hypothetical protein
VNRREKPTWLRAPLSTTTAPRARNRYRTPTTLFLHTLCGWGAGPKAVQLTPEEVRARGAADKGKRRTQPRGQGGKSSPQGCSTQEHSAQNTHAWLREASGQAVLVR